MQKLIIVGSGGFSKEVCRLIMEINDLADNHFSIEGFISPENFPGFGGISRLGNDDWAHNNLSRSTKFIVAIGNSQKRKILTEKYVSQGFSSQTLIHPSVSLSPRVQIGVGSIICSGAKLTTDIKIGRHSIINLNCTVGHDVSIGDYVTIHPGAHLSGACHIESLVEIGTGAVVLPSISLGYGCILGAGAVATNALDAGITYVGVPAKPL